MVSKTESDRDVERGSVEYNVTKRPSRSTAGNRYAKLLQGELEKLKDDFYQETYGGFNEVRQSSFLLQNTELKNTGCSTIDVAPAIVIARKKFRSNLELKKLL